LAGAAGGTGTIRLVACSWQRVLVFAFRVAGGGLPLAYCESALAFATVNLRAAVAPALTGWLPA